MTNKQTLVSTFALFLFSLLIGCSGSDGKNGKSALVRIDAEPAGENCASGGLAVHTGLDADDDGVLSESEIVETRYVCNGEGTGTNSLVNVTDEAVGGNCGTVAGKRIDVGLDTNGNGQLDAEEITSTSYVCNGTGEGINAMVNITDEPAGGNCGEAGGIRVDAGLDSNRNGQLDPEEITSTSYVCNGAPGQDGLSSRIAVVDEAPGANCAYGGQAIQTGLDANRDGILQPSEVENTRYVCNGAPGTNGTNGANALVRQEDEPAGTNCPFGGRVILSGTDINQNGYLETAEIYDIGYACNGAPGAPGHSTVFSSSAEPAGENCVAGGFRLQSGLDLDDNGILDAAEVTSTRYICHGADGANSLVATTIIPAGADCGAAAGVRMDVGVDTNGNGQLDAAEINQSRVVCNGENGLQALVRTDIEPAGVNCVDGGLRVDSGLDVNGDGELQSGEVQQSSYLCNGGSDTIMKLSSAAWGGVCPQGGLRVDTGYDGNGNGELDPAEITRTEYVCNLYFVQIAGAAESTCGLMSNGTVRCWGNNNNGQLGNGSTSQKLAPVSSVLGLSNAVQITGGGSHFCALLADTTVRCWGYNGYGQLGDGSTTQRTTPVAVSGLSGVVQIDAGNHHTCALLSDATVRCWGRNNYGQLGDGSTTNRYTPVPVFSLSNAAQISCGDQHTCARLTTSAAVCWGYNGNGQLGDGTTSNRNTPGPVFGLTTISQISAGYSHTCATLNTGAASCWGYNGNGQLGDGSTTQRNTPGPVSGITTASAISTGQYSTCAQLSDGTGRCWGYNNYGQLGDNTTTQRNTPVVVQGLANVTHITDTLGYFFCARRSDGLPQCWGYNGYGQLGDNTTTNRLIPTNILWDNSL